MDLQDLPPETRQRYAQYTLDTIAMLMVFLPESSDEDRSYAIANLFLSYFNEDMEQSIPYLIWLFAQMFAADEVIARLDNKTIEELYFNRGSMAAMILDTPEYLDTIMNGLDRDEKGTTTSKIEKD